MDLHFAKGITDAYKSSSQRTRILSEHWVATYVYCPNCGNRPILQYPNNNKAADFFCAACGEDYELKSQRGHFGTKIVGAAYRAMKWRVETNTVPNFVLLTYDPHSLAVTNLVVHPQAVFCSQCNRKEETTTTDGKTRWLDWLQYFAPVDSVRREDRFDKE
jgi:type II restriction enzyme